jgi:hypothetical protein
MSKQKTSQFLKKMIIILSLFINNTNQHKDNNHKNVN